MSRFCCVVSYAAAVPVKLAAMLAGSVCAAACWMALIAAPSDAPGARSKEIVTDGNWPEWLTVTGPTSL